MASIDQSALKLEDLLQNKSCGCINSPTLDFTKLVRELDVFMVLSAHILLTQISSHPVCGSC